MTSRQSPEAHSTEPRELRWRTGRLRLWGCSLLLAGGLLSSASAPAEIYRWTDSAGRVHFTEDLSQVPAAQRAAAESGANRKPTRSRVQIYTPPPTPKSAARPTRGGPASLLPSASRVYRVRVERAGNSMSVVARINGELNVPFAIDTGATDVVLPQWAADKLDLDLDDARTGVYGTANGLVKQKLVQLRSVSLGGAVVENVPATVSKSMSHGLLGLSYFNHFKYDIDPVSGVVTLRPNDLAEQGILRGGRSEEQWRSQFRSAYERIERAEQRLEEVPFGRSRRRQAAKEEVEALRMELRRLEREADDSRVPFGWRD